MKKIYSLFIAIIVAIGSFAQTTIPNGGMENWDTPGTQTEEPQYWNSNKTGGGNATLPGQTCFRDVSPHSGTYCAKVQTTTFIGTVVNGALTTGKVQAPDFTKSHGYIDDLKNNAYYLDQFTGRPDSFVFWYKYTVANPDYPRVEARLHVGNCYVPEAPVGGNHPDSTVNIIARALWTGTANASVGTWTRVSIPFVYVDGRTPSQILITSTSSGDPTAGTNGSILWLDDLVAIYNPAIATGTINPLTYYVSATTGAAVSVPFTLTGTFNVGNNITAQLSDAAGSFASPVTIGTLATTTSGTINATIPAGTATGGGYRIRVVSDNPALTAAANVSNITIDLCSNSVAPTATQTIAANTNGTVINVTESPIAASSRAWMYSAVSGGPYTSSTGQTGTSYTPNFPASGTYYVACVSAFPSGLTVTSNEVQINVVSNSIAPAATQNLLTGVAGNMLTVTETPSGTAREWKYGNASGGPYSSFAPLQTGMTYTPNFAVAGTYYVVCQSIISGVVATSNEVIVIVANASITTGTITGSPFMFTPSAANAVVNVPYTTNGTFNAGNIFTAQLSNGAGSFAAPTILGTVNATSSGTIAGTLSHLTPAGNGYRVRVISDNPVVTGTDNGTDLVVMQLTNAIAPSTTQTIAANTSGNLLTVAENPSAVSREWMYSMTSGGPYSSFGPVQTGTPYTPNFPVAGTYYVVCVSNWNGGLTYTSNEVIINIVSNSIAPTSSQSILVSVAGNMLTVTETPSGTAREWKFSGTSGGPYSSFGPVQSGMTYTPMFAVAGTYYVVCESTISGVVATSNEVQINVGNATITTGTILGSPYLFSPSSPDANINVPYTTSGTFNVGNTFTAQLSDAVGSFAAPTSIGTLMSTISGTISATINHITTLAGTGYRIRVISDNPAVLGSDNGVDLVVDQFHNLIAPATPQTILTNNNGATLTVTESQVATHQWASSLTSGSGYVAIGGQTGTSYTPNFSSPGIYYVVCWSTNGYSDMVTSNEVVVNVVANSITPATSQSILIGVNGNTLTVTETPNGTSREWKYSMTAGGPYSSFAPIEVNITYIPNFLAAGTYYIVCESMISGLTATSNEVIINVGTATITTGTILGSPFLFSPSAPAASVNVPYTTSGTFNAGNTFTAQLSDATGSFAAPTPVGMLSSTTSGTIAATIANTTLAGTGYRIRVIGSNPSINGSDNGVDLIVDQFHNAIAPIATQNIMYNANGTMLTVTESQTANHQWASSTVSGSGYVAIGGQTASTYTPNFAMPGTYYVVCWSTNTYSDMVTSNEVQINVANGSVITTGTITGSPYLVSPSANVQVSVNFTSDAVFMAGNTFTTELSDYLGSFASPVSIGTLSGTTIGAITATIPNSSAAGAAYRIRVTSTIPPITGSDNAADLTVIPFSISVAPMDTQHLGLGQFGTTLHVTESQPCTRNWQYSQTPGSGYVNFAPVQTDTVYSPQFFFTGTYYVVSHSTNAVTDALTSQEVVVIVGTTGIGETTRDIINAYWNGNDFMVDLRGANMISPTVELVNVTGQVVVKEKVTSATLNTISANLSAGIYLFRIVDGEKSYSGKTIKK